MKIEEVFDKIVTNAIDFLEKSVEELNQKPKYSIINFCSAVELFIKARLAAEHWTLIVTKNQTPNHDKVISGDFKSVTLDEAFEKLETVLNSPLHDREILIFKKLFSHRNKAVHFYHDAHINEEKMIGLIQEIAKEQLNAWYYLYEILKKRWTESFEHRFIEIDKINTKLKAHREFLNVVYNNILSEISRLKETGVTFEICPSCGYESQKHDNIKRDRPYYSAQCLVCDIEMNSLVIPCSEVECDSDVLFVGEGFATCSSCETDLSPIDIERELRDEVNSYIAAKSGEYYEDANCCECGESESVIQVSGTEDYFCCSCLTVFDEIFFCEWCNTPSTSMTEDSFLTGCDYCEGRFGWKDD